MLKKIIYIGLFTLVGFLAQFLVHAVVEIIYINLLLNQYETFGLGLTFSTWFVIHAVFTVVLVLLGIGIGFQQGIYWWKRLYEKEA